MQNTIPVTVITWQACGSFTPRLIRIAKKYISICISNNLNFSHILSVNY